MFCFFLNSFLIFVLTKKYLPTSLQLFLFIICILNIIFYQ
ncbi:hypothetical protein BAZSYMA_ACONTIG42923_0 [Bathymodiolus azoricus thioautotrophic gill symbiont]|uniref:Uncharacterized protein n=1 Tax=Bathymodiolus azoricus thioautotrophic gill symbiont TaxID=235205 RepID=A0A1H6JYT9_9GAMM|nr:hypothetical protein BAZSYMA_ACONTIG42923_0 [Bathymodiolus azoricus thioautotrophic gill symbiont]